MKIMVASDHAGFPLKQIVLEYLAAQGVQVLDGGTERAGQVVDYPDVATSVARALQRGECDRGILICGTGLGMSIAANRFPWVRAGLCSDSYSARQARAHNDSNVLCLGAWVTTPERAMGIIDDWLRAEYEGARHVPRLAKLRAMPGAEARSWGKVPFTPFLLSVALSPNFSVFGPLLFAGRLEEGIRTAAEAGFQAVELSLRTPGDIQFEAVTSLLDSCSLAVSAIATGQSYLHDGLAFCTPDSKTREAVVDRMRGLIDLAARFGARVIFGGVRGKLAGDRADWPRQRELAVAALRACAAYADERQVTVLIEPINRYETNYINTAAEGLALIDELGAANVRLLLDTFHMNIEEVDLCESLRRAGDRLGYVHLADSNRHAPGLGHLPFGPVFETLEGMDYRGPVGLEILPLPDDRSAALKGGHFMRAAKGDNGQT